MIEYFACRTQSNCCWWGILFWTIKACLFFPKKNIKHTWTKGASFYCHPHSSFLCWALVLKLMLNHNLHKLWTARMIPHSAPLTLLFHSTDESCCPYYVGLHLHSTCRQLQLDCCFWRSTDEFLEPNLTQNFYPGNGANRSTMITAMEILFNYLTKFIFFKSLFYIKKQLFRWYFFLFGWQEIFNKI